MRRALAQILAVGALLPLLGLTACSESTWGSRRQKPAVSGLWVSGQSATLSTSTVARLEDAGVGELYVIAATLTGDETSPLERVELPADLPSGTPLDLVLAGELGPLDPEQAALRGEAIAEAASQLRFDVESQGHLVVGLHFDLLDVTDFAAYGQFLDSVRSGLDDLFVSATLARDWIDDDALEPVTRAVDYVVPFLYGQRIRERETADAWDFAAMERRLRRLESWDASYQVGVILLGSASLRNGKGALKARTTRASMQELLWNRDLKLQAGFTLEGSDRRVYTLAAERPAKVGNWELQTGETVRVIRPATSHLEEMLKRLAEWDLSGYLGSLYYRLPAENELLSIHAESLLSGLEPRPASPDLDMTVSVQRRTGRGWLMRFGLSNRSAEFTELALLEHNYLQIELADGEFEENVSTGDFQRFELYDRSSDGELQKTFRNSAILRVTVPILEGGQRVSTGDVEIVGRGEPRLILSGRFLLPDGRFLDLGPRLWVDGGFEDERSATPAESGESNTP